MSLILQGSTSGSVTLQEPAVAGTTVLDLPAVSGTVLTTTSPKAGNVIQVVQNSIAVGVVSTTSTSFVDLTNATATITPSNTANKILVLWMSYGSNSLVAATNVGYIQQILRTSTSLASVELSAESASGGLQISGTMNFNILDAPNTTSAVTYKIQHSVTNASSTGTANNGFLTLLEIAG
jgi:hypothetical protein